MQTLVGDAQVVGEDLANSRRRDLVGEEYLPQQVELVRTRSMLEEAGVEGIVHALRLCQLVDFVND